MSNTSFCLSCDKRNTCAEICPTLEKELPKLTSGRLRGEHSFSPDILELIAEKTAFKIKYGKAYYNGRRREEERG